MESDMKNNVATYRSAGLEARWSRNPAGGPRMLVRNPASPRKHQRETWWQVTRAMFETMKEVGVVEGFDRHTLLGDIFAV